MPIDQPLGIIQMLDVKDIHYSAIRIENEKQQLVVEIDRDGKVTFGNGMTEDEISREFWKRLGIVYRELPEKQVTK